MSVAPWPHTLPFGHINGNAISGVRGGGAFLSNKGRGEILNRPGLREAAGGTLRWLGDVRRDPPRSHLLLLVLGRRWWSWADIAPRTRFLFLCVRTSLNRRLVGAINFSVVFLFWVSAHRISISRQFLFIRLSGSGSHY